MHKSGYLNSGSVTIRLEMAAESSFRRLPSYIQAGYIARAQYAGADPVALYMNDKQPDIDKKWCAELSYKQNLDSRTENAQAPFVTEGDRKMARQRMRICVGHNADGTSITRQISADGEIALADKIIKVMLESSRRGEFLDEAAAPLSRLADIQTFQAYTEDYFKTYKATRLKPTTQSGYR